MTIDVLAYVKTLGIIYASVGVQLRLPPPASLEDLSKIDRLLGGRLPEDVRSVYAEHDGSSHQVWGVCGVSDSRWFPFELLSLGVILKSLERATPPGEYVHRIERESGGRVKDGPCPRSSWLLLGWFNGGSHCIAVDMDPGRRGCAGQVISFDQSENVVCHAENLGAFLRKSVQLLASHVGEVVLDDP